MTDHRKPVVPRPSSTVCVLRPASGGAEILMVRRVGRARFMGGTWVFPGGAVDPVDRSELAASAVVPCEGPAAMPWRIAALRELVEEAGIWLTDRPLAETPRRGRDTAIFSAVLAAGARLDANRLHYFANWVTPQQVPIRFDTRFYATWVPSGTAAAADGSEIDDADWIRPVDALDRGRRGVWNVPFPTMRALDVATGFTDPAVTAAMVAAIGDVPRVEPRIVAGEDGTMRVVLPGDDDYDTARVATPGSVALPGEVG